MIKKLRVTVDGNTYDVMVELPDDSAAPAVSVGPLTTPASHAAPAVPPVISAAAPALAPAAPAAPAVSAAGPGDVPSPLAGRVTAIVVTAGQDVKEGDHLLTLEAMKMNTFVFAPRAGKVAEIKTSVGAAVEEGQSLIRIQ
ncbi:MAG: biotin/lipoyl-containing protein [Verrucomicrobiota bacterium]